jgi:hypothetical protein
MLANAIDWERLARFVQEFRHAADANAVLSGHAGGFLFIPLLAKIATVPHLTAHESVC